MASRKRARIDDIPSSSNPAPPTAAMEPDVQHSHTLPLEKSHEVVPPEPVLARTEPIPAEPQPPVVDPPTSPELEILSPPPAPALPLIIILDESSDEDVAPPDSPSCNIDDGSDFSDWMNC
ncbi:hypothetical protein GmHk_19G054426 [Glycine max]|nr:hypothetical protein GmHk_19G054426 [Glycine max]